MSKKKYKNTDIDILRAKIKQALDNKMFRLWIGRFVFESLSRKQRRFIMKSFWNEGTVAGKKNDLIDGVEGLYFTPYTTTYYDLYQEPEVVRLVNLHNVPYIPNTDQVVDVDCAIGWCNTARKPIKVLVEYYIDRMVEIQLVINTQLGLQNSPFMFGITPEMKQKADDLMAKILNHEPVVFIDIDDVSLLKAVTLNNQYNIDKLVQLYYDYESQCFNILGIDNATSDGTKDRMLLDQTNANNVEINAFNEEIKQCIQDFLDDINDLYGIKITLQSNIKPTQSLYEEGNESLEDNTNRKVDNDEVL